MADRLAKFISGVASPYLVIPAFSFWVIGYYLKSLNEFLLWAGSFLVLVLLLPFFYVYQGVRSGKFTDLHVAVREQRSAPLLVATFGALILAGIYYLMKVPIEVLSVAVALTLNGIVFILVTKLWKVSVHSAAYLGSVFVASVLVDSKIWILLIFLPLIIWARLKREKHNLWQTLTALVLTAISTSLSFYLLRIF